MINLKHVGSEKDPLNEQYLISVDQLIGSGSFGKVYIAYNCEEYNKANQPLLPLCAKEIPRVLISDNLVKSIRNEATIQLTNRSSRVLRMYAMKQTRSNVYFFLEYCPEGDLRNLIYNHVLNEGQIVFLFGEIARALCELKNQRVYHRDLKPENILLKDGGIKIADFGFSKIVQENTKNNTQVGTPLYMSPQALSSNCYDLEKNDVWAAGCLLYEMVFRRLPWKLSQYDQSVKALYDVITMDSAVSFPKDVKVSTEIKDLINLMLDIDEEVRLDWEDILNSDLIRKSYDPVKKSEISSLLASKKSQSSNTMINLIDPRKLVVEKEEQFFAGSNQSSQVPSPAGRQLPTISIKKTNSNVETIKSEQSPSNSSAESEDEKYANEGFEEYSDAKVKMAMLVAGSARNESESQRAILWRLIQMHRAMFKSVSAQFKDSGGSGDKNMGVMKLVFCVCLKLEELLYCEEYLGKIAHDKGKASQQQQQLKQERVDSNILDQIKYFIREILNGKEMEHMRLKLEQFNQPEITRSNSRTIFESTFARFQSEQLPALIAFSTRTQAAHETLQVYSNLKFIATHSHHKFRWPSSPDFETESHKALISYLMS